MKQAELRYYISINVNGQHPLMRSAQGYTEYYITTPYALFPREMQESGTELAKIFEEAGSINRGIAKPAKKTLPAPE